MDGSDRRVDAQHQPRSRGPHYAPVLRVMGWRSGGMKLGGGVSPRSWWEIEASRRAATLSKQIICRMLHSGLAQQCCVLVFERPLAVMSFLLLDIPSDNVHL